MDFSDHNNYGSGILTQYGLRFTEFEQRPCHASFSVFVLLAQALMEITGLVSPVNLRESPDYMMGWFIVGVATVILITWHVVIATKGRKNDGL